MTQVWGTDADGGYMYSDELSSRLRTSLQPLVRFRQFCDAKIAKGLNKGDTFTWNIYSDVAAGASTSGLAEGSTMPTTKFTITQGSATVTEFGNSVPFTKKLDDLSLQPVTEVIEKVLKNDAAKTLDTAASLQFKASNLLCVGTGSGSSATINITTNGTAHSANNTALNKEHVRLISDEMAERNIPSYDGTNYISLFRPRALRKLKNELEELHSYVSEGWYVIMNGEKGRYDGIRFVEQTNIPVATDFGSAPDGTDGRDRGYFFGADTVAEAISIPEEVRGKIPTDYGRARGVAWYALLGYAIVHNAGTGLPGNRIIHWTSQP